MNTLFTKFITGCVVSFLIVATASFAGWVVPGHSSGFASLEDSPDEWATDILQIEDNGYGTAWQLYYPSMNIFYHGENYDTPIPVDEIAWWSTKTMVANNGDIWMLHPDNYEWEIIIYGDSAGNIYPPLSSSLGASYPNPFNPVTTIPFNIVHPGHVTLEVFNILGEKVVTLVEGMMSVGEYNVQFDGEGLSSGVYTYSLRTGESVESGKVTLLK
jgi:hypothetical protein